MKDVVVNVSLEEREGIKNKCIEILNCVYGEVVEYKREFRINHVIRVTERCIEVVGEDFENMRELLYSGYLHDICKFMDDDNHNVLGSMIVEMYIKDDKNVDIEMVKDCILKHGFKNKDFKDSDSILSKVLHDSDKLDKICEESFEERSIEYLRKNFPKFLKKLEKLNETLVLDESLIVWKKMDSKFRELLKK